jgi:hypothetical protein
MASPMMKIAKKPQTFKETSSLSSPFLHTAKLATNVDEEAKLACRELRGMGDAGLKNYRSQKLMRLAKHKCGITSLVDKQTSLKSKQSDLAKSHSYQTEKMLPNFRTKFPVGARKLHNATQLESRDMAVHAYTEDHTPRGFLNRKASSDSYVLSYDAYSKSLETTIQEIRFRSTKAQLGSLGRRMTLERLNKTEETAQISKELQSNLADARVHISAARRIDIAARQFGFKGKLLDIKAKKPLSQHLKTKGQRGIAHWSESCKRIKRLHLHAVRSKQNSSTVGQVTGSQLKTTKVDLHSQHSTPSNSTKRSSSRNSLESYDSWNYGEQALMQSRLL